MIRKLRLQTSKWLIVIPVSFDPLILEENVKSNEKKFFLNILRTERAFKMEWKVFFIIFEMPSFGKM